MPMKIQQVNGPGAGPGAARGPDPAASETPRTYTFQRALSDQSAEAQSAQLTALVADIDRQGQKLARRADVGELERYRALVRDFLHQLVSQGFAFTKEGGFGARGRHRLHATVAVINQKLEALGREVLSAQAGNLAILAAVDDIRGLLADLLL